ncbi:hypothetical protein [Streptomyces sp. NPDC091278]|uniref:hypothetical protein n=1 Tax=Streptomyces sp. NPDC091278 TaxID=3155301 RepID=UPI003450A3C1
MIPRTTPKAAARPKLGTGKPAHDGHGNVVNSCRSPALDLRAVAADIAAHLGNPWTLNELTATPHRVCLLGPDSRELGLSLIHADRVIQLWITGFPVPDLPKNAPKEQLAARARRLGPGRSWHIAQDLAHLPAGSTDPDIPAVLHQRITDELLPAYDLKPDHVLRVTWWPEQDADEKQPDPSAVHGPDIPRAAPAPPARPRALGQKKTTTRRRRTT